MAKRQRARPRDDQQRRTAEMADLFVLWLDLVPAAQKTYVQDEADQAERIAARMRELAEQNQPG